MTALMALTLLQSALAKAEAHRNGLHPLLGFIRYPAADTP